MKLPETWLFWALQPGELSSLLLPGMRPQTPTTAALGLPSMIKHKGESCQAEAVCYPWESLSTLLCPALPWQLLCREQAAGLQRDPQCPGRALGGEGEGTAPTAAAFCHFCPTARTTRGKAELAAPGAEAPTDAEDTPGLAQGSNSELWEKVTPPHPSLTAPTTRLEITNGFKNKCGWEKTAISWVTGEELLSLPC